MLENSRGGGARENRGEKGSIFQRLPKTIERGINFVVCHSQQN